MEQNESSAHKSYRFGREGEARAKEHLAQLGYLIIAENFRVRHGEIDLIAWENGQLTFIEVKSYAADALFAPVFAVDKRKQRRIIQAASLFIAQNKYFQFQARFDVLTLVRQSGSDRAEQETFVFEIYKDAFRA